MRVFARALGATFAALFAYAAFVQLNDADWWSWLSLYVVAAALSALLVVERRAPRAMLGLGGASWLWGALLLPELIREQRALGAPFWDSELAREVSGLAIVGLAMGALWYVSRPKEST